MTLIPDDAHYIGDGVYVRLDKGFQIELLVTNGLAITSRVYLEPNTWSGLIDWIVARGLQKHFPVGSKA